MMTLMEARDLLRAGAPGVPGMPEAELLGDGDLRIGRVHTDSRSTRPGDLFVALKGERFDGTAFLPRARAAGAVAALASSGLEAGGLPGILVPDPLRALGVLGAAWRQRFAGLRLIAVTGSNGKTTVTQMVAAILRAEAAQAAEAVTLATQGNFNNAIGVPLTLLRLRDTHRMAVLELGMNHPGEIDQLARLVQPGVALINNAQREHQEFLCSVRAVAEENGAVLRHLPPGGVAVLPAGDAFLPLWRGQIGAGAGPIHFGCGPLSQVSARAAHWSGAAWQLRLHTPAGETDVRLRLAGRHNVDNALAACACALAAGASLQAVRQGLEGFEAVPGRARLLSLNGGTLLVDDSYNANPDSVQAAIALLATLPAPRLLVLGDMGESGAQAVPWHREAGDLARASGIHALLALGDLARHAALAFGDGAQHFAGPAALTQAVLARLGECRGAGSVLVKGSRFMRMEVIVQKIMENR